ncbi:MAG: D-alanyl-D-alanine carboxypeptidase family protein [Solirubrobacteraceae bacterium]|jgi:D-alanyl-D-alanine carboxypeptidase (penicillin-binding protein 5/6)
MMSLSPFMTPDQSRRRRLAAQRRRRTRRRIIAVGALALAIAAALVVMAMGRNHDARGSTSASTHGSHRSAHTSTVALAGVARSPSGLPLGEPVFALHGIGSGRDPKSGPVNPGFSIPPRAGMLFNLSTGQVLWARNPYVRLPIASLTKMMTALLTVQSSPPDAPVLITREAVNMPGSKVGVLPLHRHVPLESLLYGLLLPSGNDAAVALAQHVAGSVNRFVVRMNAEAAQLGLGCTRYSSPSGYYNANNFSCVADLAMLAHADIEQPRIASVVRTYSAVLPFPIRGGRLYLYNNNPLLIYGYPGVTGMKTGQTEAAGRCLVATAERHGVRLGAIVLHSEDPGTQDRDLLDLGFERVYHQPAVPEAPFPPGA